MGRVVTSGADAISAAAEGADLILLEVCRAVLHAKRHLPHRNLHMMTMNILHSSNASHHVTAGHYQRQWLPIGKA